MNKKQKKYNPKRGKSGAVTNFFTLAFVIVGLCVYFTVNSLWNAGLVAVIVILLFPAGFYFWIWRNYFS
ncbi:MAG: hypothetical protein FWF82_01725 [Oscillospiraceae bacterium]|nr:hypothetical protein [Oscillospiraceae bacterium]